MRLELYDPKSDTSVGWEIPPNNELRIMLKTAVGELANLIATKSKKNVLEILYDNPRFVIQVVKK